MNAKEFNKMMYSPKVRKPIQGYCLIMGILATGFFILMTIEMISGCLNTTSLVLRMELDCSDEKFLKQSGIDFLGAGLFAVLNFWTCKWLAKPNGDNVK